MLSRLINQFCQNLLHFESIVYLYLLEKRSLDVSFQMNIDPYNNNDSVENYLSNHNLLNDSILWAVPKSRRTVEKRLQRKFGWPHQVWKPLVPKKNLLMCKSCGNHYESGYLCPACYSKVKAETELLQNEIKQEIGLKPEDKEVLILYKGEKEEIDPCYKGKCIIEMKKPRPQWFSKNLLQKTTKLVEISNVKPSDLA